MSLRKWIIGAVAAGGISLCIVGGLAYQYTTKLNKELDTFVLPGINFEGVSLGGKTKKEVEQIVKQEVAKLNELPISYSLNGTVNTYKWKDLGVQYKGTEVAQMIFKEQQGSLQERFNLRKKAKAGEMKKDYQLEAYIDSAKYDAFMKDKYNEFLSNPQDASLSIVGTTISIVPSKDGEKVDKEKLKVLTEQAVQAKKVDVQVPIIAARPTRTTEDIQNMGVKEVIAEYRSPLNGRNGNQQFNVARASRSLSGALVAPDETFSFNERVGITNAANGYKTAAVYVNGKVEQSAGGGVCQVSSTFYGAILRADLSIVQRSNHSMPVHYVPLGQDATVADYGPDLKIKNNTGHYIYIQAGIENNQAVARIFGTSTGKSVDLSSKVVSETSKNVVVATYKTVTQNGQVIQSGLLHKSTYKKSA